MKSLIRTIVNSSAYQLSAESGARAVESADAERYFTRALVRMHSAEQILDAISAATGVPERFIGYPLGVRAIELAEGGAEHLAHEVGEVEELRVEEEARRLPRRRHRQKEVMMRVRKR